MVLRPPAIVLAFVSMCFGATPERRDGTRVLPVIDKQDLRFVTLSAGGMELKEWIQGITQDNQGFLWFATDGGLFRYDGYTLKPYLHEPGNPNSIGSDTLNTVYKDRSGILWIGTRGNGLDKLDPALGAITHYRHQSGKDTSLAGDNVTCIYQDRSGGLWIGTNRGLDRFNQSSETFFHYRDDPGDPASPAIDQIDSLYEDRAGNFWVGTDRGLNKLDRSNGRSTHFLHDPKNPRSLGHDYVSAIREGPTGTLWLASVFGDGLSAFDVKTQEFTRYSFHSEQPGNENIRGVTSIYEDADGSLWLTTVDNGLLKLDAGRKEFSRYLNGQTTRIFEDAEGIIWIGTRNRGLLRFSRKSLAFVNYRRKVNQFPGLRNNEIQSVGADSQGNLWIGTPSGLEKLDRNTGQLTLYQHDFKKPWTLSNAPVFATAEDRSGRLWFGTYGAGLNLFNRATGKFFAYHHDPKNPDSLSTDLILCMLVDSEGILWLGTQDGGLDRYNPADGKFKTYLPRERVSALFEDRAGVLWVGTRGDGLDRFDRKSGHFTAYHHDPKAPYSLSNEFVESIHEDRRGTLWIGTQTGLHRLDSSGNSTKLATKDGLPDPNVKAILEDRRGDLWLATHNGLSHFSPQTGEFRNYFESDGLPGQNFDLLGDAACMAPDGTMVFGSSDGVSVFDPDKLSPNPYVPPIVLTDLLLFNKPVRPGRNSPLENPIWGTNALTLDHNQNIFTLEFAALSYGDPDRNRYRYRLEGLEKDWNEVDSSRRVATYTNLPAKKYILRVQGSNNDLVWNNAGISLAITVLPPWWGMWWFRTVFVIFLAALAVTAHLLRIRGLRSTAVRLELQVATRTHELEMARDAAESANRAKSAFLSLMSHELRTPLNAILGFASLLRGDVASEKHRGDLDIISRSGQHLLGMIDELLDLARIEAGRGTAEIAPCDLKRLIRDVADMMRVRALQKNLELRVAESPAFPRFVETDDPKVRQMLINLLGNAIKHTGRGSVTLRLSARAGADAEHILLNFEVEDTGIGISAEDQERIFEPFVQVGEIQRRGTGLGLAITRQYAIMLGGSIRVASAPGEGSRFRLELPATCAEPLAADSGDAERKYILAAGQPEYRILVVDDEPENRQLLLRLLQEAGFQTRLAEEGQQAVEIFRNWRPHFIWMDLRMAGVHGIEAARRVRELDGGQEVKIAALTASTNARVVEGMDDFVRKPYRASEIFDCMARHLGASYRSDSADQRPREEVAPPLRPEALAAIPDDLRAELTNALLTLDIERITPAIRRIAELDATLGLALASHAQRYAFTEVWELLRDAESSDAAQNAKAK